MNFKFITSLLSLLYVLLVGTPQPKHSLHKQPTKSDFYRNLNFWIQRNFYIIALVSIIVLLIGFVVVCFAICGVSAVESGIQYNHFQEVI